MLTDDIAIAMAARRLVLIEQPLARIWPDLASVAVEATESELTRLRETQAVLVEALQSIVGIQDSYEGIDWQEITEAREIARTALARVQS
jgi:hypothetical protein